MGLYSGLVTVCNKISLREADFYFQPGGLSVILPCFSVPTGSNEKSFVSGIYFLPTNL
jgi:hypothetical protein